MLIYLIKPIFFSPFLRYPNDLDLTRAEVIKKRWQEYTEQYKKYLHDPEFNHGGMITHLEPDTLKCKVKWA